ILSRPHDPSVTVPVRRVLIDVLSMEGRVLEMMRESDLTAPEEGVSEGMRAQLHAVAAAGPLYRGEPQAAAAAAEQARREGEQAGDDTAVCLALVVSGLAALTQADAAEAIATLEEARERSRHSHSKAELRSTYSPYILLGLALAQGDRVEESIQTFHEGLRLSNELGFAGNLPLFHWGLAQFHFLVGQWDDAIAEAEAGFALGREVGAGMGSTMAHVVVALIAFHRNELDLAEEALARAEAAFATFGPHFIFDWLEGTAAALAEARGEQRQALALLERARDRNVASRVFLDHPFFGPDLVRLSSPNGYAGYATATATVAEVEEVARRLDTPSAAGAALRCRGLLDDDVDLLLRAVAVLRRGPRPLERALACEDAATALSRRSRTTEAIELLQQAVAIYQELGARRDLARVEAHLRSFGVHRGLRRQRRDRPSCGWESLTPTESEIVRLVSQGLTNREIGERLFISPRTVETHISHVFRKLGMASRSALRAEASRRGAGPPMNRTRA
nr:LuxR C-terminal-related transcriptional regulator [Actinomycetota bacterium]